ncbi:MAG TPA: hypothetical protein VFA77_18055 [Candidatus Eisenbacteria bacterium]|nr:hypothetical protein [Candidatus Eisenbacteria bacterium]
MNLSASHREAVHKAWFRWPSTSGLPVVTGVVLLAAIIWFSSAAEPRTEPKPAGVTATNAATPQEIQLRGRVVCLEEEMHRLFQTDLAVQHEHLFGFRADDGKYYTLLRTKFSEALFMDQRLREKELILKGRLFPNTQIFEPITLRSVRDGVVYELYYYCTICDIESVSPAPCACCQGPVELVEKPLRASH